MKRALQEVSDMATSLEASGVDRQQAGATLEAIANSIEKFAVTPERLRETVEESQQALYERIREETDRQFEVVNRRLDDLTKNTNERFNDVLAELRAVSSKLFNLTQAMALGIAGVAGIWLMDQLF